MIHHYHNTNTTNGTDVSFFLNRTVTYNCYYRKPKTPITVTAIFSRWKQQRRHSLVFSSSPLHISSVPPLPISSVPPLPTSSFRPLPIALFSPLPLLVEFFHIWIDKVQDIFLGR